MLFTFFQVIVILLYHIVVVSGSPFHHHMPQARSPFHHHMPQTRSPFHHHMPQTRSPFHHHMPQTRSPFHHYIPHTCSPKHHHILANIRPILVSQITAPKLVAPLKYENFKHSLRWNLFNYFFNCNQFGDCIVIECTELLAEWVVFPNAAVMVTVLMCRVRNPVCTAESALGRSAK